MIVGAIDFSAMFGRAGAIPKDHLLRVIRQVMDEVLGIRCNECVVKLFDG